MYVCIAFICVVCQTFTQICPSLVYVLPAVCSLQSGEQRREACITRVTVLGAINLACRTSTGTSYFIVFWVITSRRVVCGQDRLEMYITFYEKPAKERFYFVYLGVNGG